MNSDDRNKLFKAMISCKLGNLVSVEDAKLFKDLSIRFPEAFNAIEKATRKVVRRTK